MDRPDSEYGHLEIRLAELMEKKMFTVRGK